MDFDEFNALVQTTQKDHPRWFMHGRRDAPATDEDVLRAEEKLGVKFPPEYVSFLKAYGGGDFCFSNVFSVNPSSKWYVVDHNARVARLGAKDFLAISDDQAGGYYGFRVSRGVCESKVVYYDWETNEMAAGWVVDNLFSFISEDGLRY
jgi:SMI1-KNR4 cell-wall